MRDRYVLRVTAGGDAGRVFDLIDDRMVVGRSNVGVADIRINEILAAPRHFEIRWDPERETYLVVGWEHPNPVYLNGTALKAQCPEGLKGGDEIRLGNTVFIYDRNGEW